MDKKIFLLFCCLIITSAELIGQTDKNRLLNGGKPYLGLYLGGNYHTEHLSIPFFNDLNGYQPGGQIGMIVGKGILPYLNFRAEPGIVKRGTSLNIYLDNVRHAIDTWFVSVPLMAELVPSEEFSVFLGPEIGYRFYGSEIFGDITNDVRGNYRSPIEFGFQTGLSVNVERFEIGLRYYGSLVSILPGSYVIDDLPSGSESLSGFNRVFSFHLAYKFVD